MTKTKFFSILAKMVANGFNTNGAKAEVVTYFAGNTDLCIVVEETSGKFKRVSFHREPKAAADLCEKMNKWIVRFNMQQVEEVVEVETVTPDAVTTLAVAINDLPNVEVMVSSEVLKAAVAACPGDVEQQINKVVELWKAKLVGMPNDHIKTSLESALDALVKGIEAINTPVTPVTPAPIFPVSVLVHWSESGEFKGEEVHYTFEEFERKAKNAAALAGSGMGYDKTKITVIFNNGAEYGCRLDLAADDTQSFQVHAQQMIAYSKTEKGAAYYTQVGLMDCVAFLETIDFNIQREPTKQDEFHTQYADLMQTVEESSYLMKLRLFCDVTGQDPKVAELMLEKSGGFLLGAIKLHRGANHAS
ncbi:hypothetical protein M977_04343 [Buttiauxella gaviniae ATCC 51604]|uniref:Large polyvalent protein associated domain-containing protein n=1 Tax=Buttiauxella gaviniae ATCC 51604 TaxID=1354253 RepID=A0A1B7HN95_9ENTR|nr:LPD25 domain-containing protein [Buttiauxella gaviniae]OAT17097.1 hypothetical protein M977_04343 [Buttiauxella gaviniae ATCC 51604]